MALIGLSLATAAPEALAAFYQNALGFRRLGPLHLAYGDSEITLRHVAGRPIPPGASNDAIFQHFAMIVDDIEAAYKKLHMVGGFIAITSGGPVRLPPASGGAIAYKFRDPEGHPLEFLQAPTPAPARIDHTAIVVADSQESIGFYAGFGLSPQGGSLNHGPEQAALDALDTPVVQVTRLGSTDSKLALELLCYLQPEGAAPIADKTTEDLWATRVFFTTGPAAGLTRDPDGHDIFVEDQA